MSWFRPRSVAHPVAHLVAHPIAALAFGGGVWVAATLGASSPVVAAELASPESPPGLVSSPAPDVTEAPPAAALEALPPATPERPDRPELGLALGMGVSWDRTGFVDRTDGRVPSFAVAVEARGLSWGGAVEMLATSASGRFPFGDRPVDRLGLGALVTVRPWATAWSAESAVGFTLEATLRSLGRQLMLAAGPGYEHVAAGASSAGRWGVCVALSDDLTLWRDPAGSELRLRLTARRFWGTSANLPSEPVSDTVLDLGLALAVVF